MPWKGVQLARNRKEVSKTEGTMQLSWGVSRGWKVSKPKKAVGGGGQDALVSK